MVGFLPGWWLGEDDGRPTEAYVSAQRWDDELKATGFCVDSISHDGYFMNTIVARPTPQEKSRRLTILHAESANACTNELLEHIGHSYQFDLCTLQGIPKPGQDIVSVLDLQEPFLHNAVEADFQLLKQFLSNVNDARVFWVTKAAQASCRDPNYALVLGFARSMRSELALDFATLELDNFDMGAWDATIRVLSEYQKRRQLDGDRKSHEYAIYDGHIHIGRYHWFSISEKLLRAAQPSLLKRLTTTQLGSLESLHWKQCEAAELGPLDVKVTVRTVGLNFGDIVTAMGLNENQSQGLGCGYAGIVTETGLSVQQLKAGDRVLSLSMGSFSTSVINQESQCEKFPNSLSFAEAATMPCAYATAIHCLMDVARLSNGQVSRPPISRQLCCSSSFAN
jgi:hypothetical protein